MSLQTLAAVCGTVMSVIVDHFMEHNFQQRSSRTQLQREVKGQTNPTVNMIRLLDPSTATDQCKVAVNGTGFMDPITAQYKGHVDVTGETLKLIGTNINTHMKILSPLFTFLLL